jgi:hypothetical protein
LECVSLGGEGGKRKILKWVLGVLIMRMKTDATDSGSFPLEALGISSVNPPVSADSASLVQRKLYSHL